MLLVVSTDPALADDLAATASLGCAEVSVAGTAEEVRASWAGADAVVLDAAAVGLVPGLARGRAVGRRLAFVSATADLAAYRVALAAGAEVVLGWPDDAQRLLDWVAPSAHGVVVGLLGARGGAGTSTVAVAVALAARRSGLSVALVDTDEYGGGLAVLMGAESVPGLRWSDLPTGQLAGQALLHSLPVVDGVPLLSGHHGVRSGVDPGRVPAIVAALRSVVDVVVLDAGRTPPDLGLDRAVLVVPSEVRAVLAASQLAGRAEEDGAAVGAVVVETGPSGLTADAVAAALRRDVLAVLPVDPALRTAVERGSLVSVAARGPLCAAAEAVLAVVPCTSEKGA